MTELGRRLGALTERNFRLVFSSTTISLAFAVLQISNSPSALGAVLAARQLASAAVTVAAGVWADRLPRHLVLVAAAIVQGCVQAVSGLLVVTGNARVSTLAALALVFGLADGFVIPASQGLVPTIVSAVGVGAILGGLLALRLRPRRPLLASCLAATPYGLQTLAIGLGLPLPALVAVSAIAGIGIAVHLTFWFTVFQREVPEAARSRVSSYDALGSFVLIPLGSAIAGPLASLIGISTTLILSGAIS